MRGIIRTLASKFDAKSSRSKVMFRTSNAFLISLFLVM